MASAQEDQVSESLCAIPRLPHAHVANSTFSNSVLRALYLDGSRVDLLKLPGTLLESSVLSATTITNTDLWPFIESSPRHQGQSSLDYQSVAKTIAEKPSHPSKSDPYPSLRRFLENSGMPSVAATYLIESIRSLDADNLRSPMQSTFISYGGPDESFAMRLNADLEKNGVTTFFFPFDAVFGEKLHSTMRRVDEYDRVILVCSAQSLHRKGVQNEIEKVLEREAREGGSSLLIPIAIDDYVFSDWEPVRRALRQEILSRVVWLTSVLQTPIRTSSIDC